MNPSNARLLTYADYAAMPDDGKRYELIDGMLFEMSAPTANHQIVIVKITAQLDAAVTNRALLVLCAPFDVRLPKAFETPDGATTVVQPDILVMNRKGVNGACLTGAPLFIVEVLSPSNTGHDRKVKLAIYERHGVLEYWIVDPKNMTVDMFRRAEAGFHPAERCDFSDRQLVLALPGVSINLPSLRAALDPNFAESERDAEQEFARDFQSLTLGDYIRMRKTLKAME